MTALPLSFRGPRPSPRAAARAAPTQPLDPIHPGEILEEEFMRPLGLSAKALEDGRGQP